MSRFKVLVSALVMLIAPATALAQAKSPKWSYVEAGFIDFDPDAGPSDDGSFYGGSFRLLKMFHIVGEYQDVGDYTFWNVGGGWHGLLGDKADLFGQILWTDVENDNNNISDDGYDLQGGVRWKINDWFELLGQVNWLNYGDAGDDTTFEVGGLFLFLKGRMGVGARYETGDADTARAYFRFNFGK
jgi:hypothetical protein